MLNSKVLEFLLESNAIEAEYDARSLYHAAQAWEYIASCDFLDSAVINQAHKIMMREKLGMDAGKYRNKFVTIGGRVPPQPYMVPHLMANWFLDFANASTPEDIKIAHIRYETIHPHLDGNGRTGRLIMNWQRAKHGLPVLVIHESEKEDYYTWFRET